MAQELRTAHWGKSYTLWVEAVGAGEEAELELGAFGAGG